MSRTILDITATKFEDRFFNLTQACFKAIDSDLTNHRIKLALHQLKQGYFLLSMDMSHAKSYLRVPYYR
ncbi:MAG: hypothetical protein QNJ18_08820 [Xenococcaceae cyanobacterium MO_167.B52]|nr:hypothetical protein [Xenococcaceae cyanobacterium MO_167.B52]